MGAVEHDLGHTATPPNRADRRVVLPILRLVATTIAAGRKAGIPVAMCGEMAGDARYTKLLLGMGLGEFSVHPNALLEVKQIIGETRVAPARRFTQRILRSTHASTRHALVEELNRTGP